MRIASVVRQATLTAFTLAAMGAPAVQAAVIEFFDNTTWSTAAGPGLTVIGFEGIGAGAGSGVALTGAEYSGQGLTIVQRDGSTLYAGNTFFVTPPTNVVGSAGISSSWDGSFFNDDLTDNIDFKFSAPTYVAGLWIGNLDPGPTTVEFLASDMVTVLATEVFALGHPGMLGVGFDNRIWYGITSDVAIGAIRTIEPANDGDLILYDDISFAPIPEPGTVALLSLGLVALAVGHRRRRG